MNKSKKILISWHYQARSRNLAGELDLELKEYFRNDNIFLRHFLSSVWSIKILLLNRPDTIVIQYSFLLLMLTALYKVLRFNRVKLIVDCHTKALRRRAKGILNLFFWPLKLLSFRSADITIISNEGLVPDIMKLHNNYFILPDKIPEFKHVNTHIKNEKYCVYVSTFAVDEPFEEIPEVAELLKGEIKLYWTGKCPEPVQNQISKQKNIKLTGYLSDDDYINLIRNADCILALTTEEDCLQSAAYEALAVEVPFVVSKTNALMKFFGDAAVYSLHNSSELAAKIRYALNNRELLVKKIKKVREEKEKDFQTRINELKAHLVN